MGREYGLSSSRSGSGNGVVKATRCVVSGACSGFTLVEAAITLVIFGILVMSVAKGQELIQSARVKDSLAQQDAVEQAVLAFQDRFRALPGD